MIFVIRMDSDEDYDIYHLLERSREEDVLVIPDYRKDLKESLEDLIGFGLVEHGGENSYLAVVDTSAKTVTHYTARLELILEPSLFR
jgi:hypothetical protein